MAGFSLFVPSSSAQEQDEGFILLGAPISLSGKYLKEGTHVRNGYDLAIKQVNRKGGVQVGDKSYRLKLIYYNDASDAERSAALAEHLLSEDGVKFMLGPYSSTLTRSVQQVTERHGIPLVQANGASRALHSESMRFHFAVLSPANLYLSSVVDLFAEQVGRTGGNLGDATAALIFQQDTFSQDVRLGALERLEAHGIGIVVDGSFSDELDNIGPVLEQVKESKPDLLLISGHAKGAVTAARQIEQLQIDAPMIAMTQCDSAQIEALHPLGAEYVICSKQWHKDLDYRDQDSLFGGSKEFVERFERNYGYDPPYHAAESAAAVQVMADALRRAGTLDPGKVRDALAATDFTSFYGKIKFDRHGSNAAKDMVLSQIIGGEYVLVSPSEFATSPTVFPRPTWAER